MAADQVAEHLLVFFMIERFEIDHIKVAERVEQLVLVENVGDAAAHAGAKLRPVRPSTTTVPPVMYSQP